MKTTRPSSLRFRIIAILVLGALAFVPGLNAQEVVSTLATTAPIYRGSNPYGFDFQKSAAQKITPTKAHFASSAEALAACQAFASLHGGSVVMTSGTPSMEPLIHGKTYVVVQDRPFESIAMRDLLVYMGRPDSSKQTRVKMLHRTVEHDRFGWMMSGDNNRWSESWDRVTPETYVGVVVALFEFPQA